MSTLISIVVRIVLGAVGLGGSGLGLSPIVWIIRRRRARRMASRGQMAPQPAPGLSLDVPQQMAMALGEPPALSPARLSNAVGYPTAGAPAGSLLSTVFLDRAMLRRRRHWRRYYR